MRGFLRTFFLLALLFAPDTGPALPAAAPGESETSLSPSLSPAPARERELVILTIRGPTTYRDGPGGAAGFEHDLATAFAQSIGARPRFVLMAAPGEILDALARGEGDLGAAGLVRSERPEGKVRFGPSYQSVSLQVVCGRGRRAPSGVMDLPSRTLVVPAGSGEERTLAQLRQALPALAWESPEGAGAAALLAAVSRGKWDCTLASSALVALERRHRPGLKVAFDLGGPEPLAWALGPGSAALESRIITWLDRFRQSGQLDALLDRYYGFVEGLTGSEIQGFRGDVENVLPGFRKLFETAADKHDLPWTLLAALAYQESGWNPAAEGPRGTAGMMMLAAGTARLYGVTDPFDPVQSIEAGAGYLARMRAMVPKTVKGPDREWFALAAYNIGVAHMKDAYTLASRMGKNPNRWADLQEILPLLSEDEHQKTLRYGFARGEITVEHVKSVRNYQNMIERALGQGP
ncbi:MAG: membrane-bound lytic murein transglycosylase MltF [Deltaproteobacteria bacterium]|nr:membrane-bound lytic murein transglycosylase MltF [Deltaproteobacteria bacterium]